MNSLLSATAILPIAVVIWGVEFKKSCIVGSVDCNIFITSIASFLNISIPTAGKFNNEWFSNDIGASVTDLRDP